MARNAIKTVTAGRLVYAVAYSRALGSEEPAVRQAKTKISSAARARLNFKAAWQKLELLLAANFEADDLFVTMTYDDAHLPPDRDEAIKRVRAYIGRLRRQRKRHGLELRYLYNVEEMPDEPDGQRRLHHHMVVSRGDLEELRSLWGCGAVHIERLLDGDFDSYEARARYMVKERHPGQLGRKVGLRAWVPSRNLVKPSVETQTVPEGVVVAAPPGAFVLDRHEESNGYGMYVYIKYLLPMRRHRRP